MKLYTLLPLPRYNSLAHKRMTKLLPCMFEHLTSFFSFFLRTKYRYTFENKEECFEFNIKHLIHSCRLHRYWQIDARMLDLQGVGAQRIKLWQAMCLLSTFSTLLFSYRPELLKKIMDNIIFLFVWTKRPIKDQDSETKGELWVVRKRVKKNICKEIETRQSC